VPHRGNSIGVPLLKWGTTPTSSVKRVNWYINFLDPPIGNFPFSHFNSGSPSSVVGLKARLRTGRIGVRILSQKILPSITR